MGIYFKPDMSTAMEVPAADAVRLLHRQLQVAALMAEPQAPQELKRGDLDQPRYSTDALRHLLRR